MMGMMVDGACITVVPVGDRTNAILADDLRCIHENELWCVGRGRAGQCSAVQCKPHLLEQVGVQSSDGVAVLVLLQKIGDVQLRGVDQEGHEASTK